MIYKSYLALLLFIPSIIKIWYDDSNTILNGPKTPLILNAWTRWDDVYFEAIADRWYAYENEFAFAPLWPLFLKFFSRGRCENLCLER